LVREDISYRLIEPYLKPHQIMRGVDSGFTYQPVGEYSLRTKLNLKPAQKLVAVSVRKWFDPSKQAVYETAIAEFVTLLIHHHYQVVFIPQCTAALEDDDDRDVALSVASHLKSTKAIHVITDDLTYAQVQLAYHDVDYVVGTRFHSVIFGLTNFTPSIAIEYEHKTRGIMRELGLEDWTINIAAVRGKSLYELFEKLVANRELYRAHLQQVIPPYAARSDEVIAQFRLAAASATIPRPDQPQP
jgi:colanic acid/amylovoran biosynthesis protein